MNDRVRSSSLGVERRGNVKRELTLSSDLQLNPTEDQRTSPDHSIASSITAGFQAVFDIFK